MQFSFGEKISCMSLFRGVISANLMGDLILNDSRYPSTRARPNYPKKTGFIILMGHSFVLQIHRMRDIAKVSYSVVVWITINMVKPIILWPMSMDIEPRKVMGEVSLRVNQNQAPPLVETSSNVANFYAVARSNAARKNAGLLVVVQQFFKALLRKRRIHSAHLSLRGDEWEVATASSRLSLLRTV